MSIIDRSPKQSKMVQKKDESTKSDKSVVSKTFGSKKTAAQSGGYELVSPGPKKNKAIGGIGTGYELLSKKQTAGYELVGPASGSGKKSKTVQDSEEPLFWEGRNKSAKEKKKGVDIVLIVAIVVLVLFVLALIGGLAYVVYKYVINKPPLPDLTNLCREAQEVLDVEEKCYFHPKKYADNCTSTRCSTIGIKIAKKGKKSYKVEKLSALVVIDIPNETPCGNYSWCYNGKCVKTNDVRIKDYEEKVKPREGGWRITCDKPECINFNGTGGKSIEHEFEDGLLHCMDPKNSICDNTFNLDVYGKKFQNCDDGCSIILYQKIRNDCTVYWSGVRLLSYAWRVCDNPLPLNSEREFCWYGRPNPLVSVESCALCPKSINVTQAFSSCDSKSHDGRKCKVTSDIEGVCFHDICVEIPEHEYKEKSALCPK